MSARSLLCVLLCVEDLREVTCSGVAGPMRAATRL